jgi:glycosyltransferase involved in cell wall biosynthesis
VLKPIRVIIDARCIGDQLDGIGRHCLEIVQLVVSALPSLNFLLLIRKSLNIDIKKMLPADLPLHEIGYSHVHPNTLFFLGSTVDSLGADLYHSPFMLQPLFMKTPGIITIHDSMWIKKPWLVGGGIGIRTLLGWGYFRTMVYLSAKAAKRILTVSETTRQEIYNWGCCDNKVEIILPSLNSKFSPTRDLNLSQRCLAKLGLTHQGFFLHVTNAKPYKNSIGVIRAFAKISRQISLCLVIVGRTSDMTKSMIGEIRKLKISDRVKVLGAVSEDELLALLRSAMALVFPSFYEGLGLPVLEAMGSGCPVITSKNGALEETAGDAALFVDPCDIDSIADGMAKLASDQVLRESLRGFGLERVSSLKRRSSTNDIIRIYEDICK